MNIRYERAKPTPHEFLPETKIIWHPSQVTTYYERPVNACAQFRKAFELERAPKHATVRLFADTHYILYINGKQIGRGPCRSDPRWKYYDTYDVTDCLTEGENVIAAMVMYYGYGTGKSVNRIPAFFLQLDATYHGDVRVQIGTNASWQVRLSEAFDQAAPRINGCKGCIEVFDNRKAKDDFAEAICEEDGFVPAKERDVKMSPYWNLLPCPIPNLKERTVAAKTVIAGGIGNAVKGYDTTRLHTAIGKELQALNISHMYVLGTEGEFPPVENDRFSYVICDFEKIRAGYLCLDITGYDGDVVDVVYAEELFDGKPVFDEITYRPISRFILKDGENHLETKFNYEAFRYVMLIFRNHIRKNELHSVSMRERFYPAEKSSVFKGNEQSLQRIWDICIHTLSLCMQDGFLDSPSREQQQWMGDGRFQAIMNYYVTGDSRMHEKLLLQIAQSQDIEGMTCSRYPDENHNLPPIASFCLQWVCSFGDLYAFTKKTDLIERLWNNIIAAMRWFTGFENEAGLLEDLPYWQYYDMSKAEDGESADYSHGGIISLANMMYMEAVQTVADLSQVVNQMEDERYFRQKARKLRKAIKKTLWNAEKGAYCDCVVQGEMSPCISEAVNAMAILVVHDKKDKETASIVRNVLDSTAGQDKKYRVSPYFMLPYYRALQKAGREDIALSETLARYGGMLDADATATWEHWELSETRPDGTVFRHSACHAWAAAPIVFVAEGLLGIHVNDRKGAYAAPNGQLLRDAEASIVTPAGVFEIKIENGNVKKNVIL